MSWRPWLEPAVLRQMRGLPPEAWDVLVRALARICDDPYDRLHSMPLENRQSRAQKIVEENLRNLARPGVHPFKLVNRASTVFGDAYGIATGATIFAAVRALEESGELATVQPASRIRDRMVGPA
jgi:hypothetical protein